MKKIFPVLILFIFFSCKKSNDSNTINPPPNDLKSKLMGNWKVVKYIAANFDTTNGRPYIPNDTIYPIHNESLNFFSDSVIIDT